MLQQLEGPLGGGKLLVVVHFLGHGAHFHLGGALAAAVLQLLGQLGGHLRKNLQQQRVEGPALPLQDHFHRLLMGEGGLVDPGAGQRVVHIGQGHDLGGNGDAVPLEPIRVAPPVPPLVVPAADVPSHLHQGAGTLDGNGLHHVRADDGVALHDGELLIGKPAGLVENFPGNGDFAHVVEGGGGTDEGDVRGGDGVTVGLNDQPPQQ